MPLAGYGPPNGVQVGFGLGQPYTDLLSGTIWEFTGTVGSKTGWFPSIEAINVVALGADPTGTALSDTAFASALALCTGYRRRIFVPSGTFKLSAGFTLNHDGITLEGVSPAIAYTSYIDKGTVIFFAANVATGISTGTSTFCTIKNLTLYGNSLCGTGISFSKQTKIENVQVYKCTGAGFWGSGDVNSSLLKSCTSVTNDVGFKISGNQPTVCHVIDSVFEDNTTYGVDLTAGNTSFTDCIIESSGVAGVHAITAAGNVALTGPCYFTRCWFEANAIHVKATAGITASVKFRFERCEFYTNAPSVAQDYNLVSTNDYSFVRCVFGGTGTHSGVLDASAIRTRFIDSLDGNPTLPTDVGGTDSLVEGMYSGSPTQRLFRGGTFIFDARALAVSPNMVQLSASLDTAHNYGLGLINGGGGVPFFTVRDVTAAANRLVIDDSGRVGIGTAAPTESLQVSGTLKVTGAIKTARQSVNAPYSMSPVDFYVLNLTTGAITLQQASAVTAGTLVIIKSETGITTTVTAFAGDTVEHGATDVLGSLAVGRYISNGGTNWEKV